MGAVERQIDRHADELGRLEDIENRVDKVWREQRDELAERLAKGSSLRALGEVVLEADDVADRLFGDNPDEANSAMVLCVNNPQLGGKHIARMMREAAEKLVEESSSRFKADIENDIENGEVA